MKMNPVRSEEILSQSEKQSRQYLFSQYTDSKSDWFLEICQ